MKRSLLLALASLPLLACDVPPADEVGADPVASALRVPTRFQDTLIDFDWVNGSPFSYGLSDGSVVDGAYSGYGVTFSCVACTGGHAYARFSTSWGNNGVSVFPAPYLPFFDARWGAVKAEFATPHTWVSIDARPVLAPEGLGTPTARPWIEAYDSNGQLIGRTYYPLSYGDPAWGSARGLIVNAGSARIKYVLFSSQYVSGVPPVYAAFDNLLISAEYTLRPYPYVLAP